MLFSFALFVAGIFVGMYKGWKLSFLFLISSVVLVPSIVALGSVLEKGFAESLKAYGQSAGYAEQALNAIRVVTSFG